jgi:hypothetical protein
MMSWKECGSTWSWHYFWYYPAVYMEGLRTAIKNLGQNSLVSEPRLEPEASQISSKRAAHSSTTLIGGLFRMTP